LVCIGSSIFHIKKKSSQFAVNIGYLINCVKLETNKQTPFLAKELNSVNQGSFLTLLQMQYNKCKDILGWNWHLILFWITNISDTTSITVKHKYVYILL